MNSGEIEYFLISRPEQPKPTLVGAPMHQFLEPGVTFHEGIDEVAKKIAMRMPLPSANRFCRRSYSFEPLSKQITAKARETKFNGGSFLGTTHPKTLTILPPESRLIKHPESHITFLVVSELSSTGRPHAGFIETLFTLYIKDQRTRGWEHNPQITSSMKLLKGRRDIDDISKLIETSQESWAEALRQALRARTSAGLPGLGKTR